MIPKVGDIHYSWTGTEWIPCEVYKITKSGKSFMCFNYERGYGSIMPKRMKEYKPEPMH